MKFTSVHKTVLSIVAGFIVLWFFNRTWWFLTGIFLFALIGLLVPIAGKFIHWFWYKLGRTIGLITSPILLTLFYFFCLTPMALLRRLFSSSDLLSLRRNESSQWKSRNHQYTPEDLKHPW